ncbi:MAG: ATP-binding protein [bacterium]|nr:ATP-binding protein [bacterium]
MRAILGRWIAAPVLVIVLIPGLAGCSAESGVGADSIGRTLTLSAGKDLPAGDVNQTIYPGRFLDYYDEAAAYDAPPPWRRPAAEAPIDWQASRVEYPNPGMSPRAYWFRLRLESPDSLERYFYIPHSFDELNIFIQDSANENQARELCAIGRRDVPIKTRRPVCRLSIPAGVSEFYIRTRNQDSQWLPAQILSEGAYHRRLETENLLYGAYFGVLWIMALYNFLVYLRTREISFLPYVGFTIANIAYFFVQSGFAAYLFYPEHPQWHHIIGPSTAAVFGITACAFASSFLRLRERSPRVHRCLAAAQIALGVIWILALFEPSSGVLFASLLGGLGFGICLLLPLIALHSMLSGFAPARIYFVAVLAFFVGGALFIARILGWLPANALTMYAFPVGSLLQVALFSLALADRIEDLQRKVAHSLKKLKAAHRKLGRSEERYRQLVEGSNDLIFVLSPAGLVVQVNASIQPLLGLRADDLIGRSLASVLYSPPESETGKGFQRALLETQIQELSAASGAVRFPLRLANRLGQPVDMDCSLEGIAGEGETDDPGGLILGRAAPPERNVLVDGLQSERGVFTIGNFLSDADALYHRVTQFLERYFETADVEMVIFALREMIMNAIEHGNLAISFDEKTEAQEQGRYLELLLERQRQPELRERRVLLHYSLNARRVVYRVTDAGAGFDHRAICQEANTLMGDMKVSHGRGIALARQFFDIVRYNRRGNSVTLVRFTDRGAGGDEQAADAVAQSAEGDAH